MRFLPIVSRELRVASRQRSTYWVRSAAALVVLAVSTWFFIITQSQAPSQIAMGVFSILTGGAVLYCLFSGVRSTADCLSQEKREGTLGLLFLTDLKGYDVVFGKLVATSLRGFYGVLAVVPMLALPLLLGGVTPGEFGRMALVAVNTLFFSLAVGMFVSALCRSARNAMGITLLLILLIAAGLPAIGSWWGYVIRAQGPPVGWLLPSPGTSYFTAFDSNYRVTPQDREGFWGSVAVVHALAWFFLVLACVRAPRSWQDRPAGVQALRWRERWRLWSYGDAAERAGFRKLLLDQNAYFWLAARARLKPACVWAVLALLGCGWAWGLAKYHRDWLSEFMFFVTGIILNLLIKGWFATEAGRQIAADRTQGSLELLLSTPLTVRDILRGQLLALRRQFLGPAMLVLVLFVLFMRGSTAGLSDADDRESWVLFWAALIVLMLADVAALYWVGMWQGLTAKNPNRATSATLARIMVLPVAAFAALSMLLGLVTMNHDFNLKPKFFIAMWVGLSLATDAAFGAWARHKLLTEFRAAAAQRYAPGLGFWKRLLGAGQTVAPAPPPVKMRPETAPPVETT
ncbi:MAG TPA: ABC transporter permease subunit [Candidatus Acidoferrum sp.]|nr:ABC transporter permease subunit [Candidatus Acidoferrum sp.]